MQVSGELCEHAVVFDTGYLAGADHLTGDGRRAAVVVIRCRFGDHYGQVGLSGDIRCVDVLENETEVLLEFSASKFPDIGQAEFHFRIGAADVAVVFFGIVVFFVAYDARENRVCRIVPRCDHDISDFEVRGIEPEIHPVVASGRDRTNLGLVADHFCPDVARRVAAFERVEPFVVGGDAGGRTREQDDGVGNRLARLCVRDRTAHPGVLGGAGGVQK